MKAGIVCDLNFNRHVGLKSYFYAIQNIFGSVKIINSFKDLFDIKILFIGNEHFQPHRQVWENDLFIKTCNNLDIKVVIFSVEKIFSSSFPHNETIQNNIKKFENLFQYAHDVEDIEKLNCKLIRGCISSHYKNIELYSEKINKCAFLGSIDCFSYQERQETIKKIEKEMEIVFPERQTTWEEYMKELSKYKFVLSPLGNSNGLALKFYEILFVNSIPIQQVKPKTLEYYKTENEYKDCIFFENPKEIVEKINNCSLNKSSNIIYLENEISSLLKTDNII